jgi:tetratricopeptide (TPR) repeat protein
MVFYYFNIFFLSILILLPLSVLSEESARVAYDSGVLLAAQGNFSSAKSSFQKALQIDSLFVPAKLNLSIVEDVLAQRLEDEAALHYFNAIEWGNRDSLEMKINELSRALEINPRFGLAYNERGIAFAKVFDFERAINDYDSALTLLPEAPEIYFNKALSCDNNTSFNEARDAYIKFLEFTPPNYDWYIIYARKRIHEINQMGAEEK